MADDIGAAGSSASAAGSSPAPSTAASSPTAVPAAPATGAPAPGTSAAQDPAVQKTGSPPEDRWPSILDNARTKTRSEVEAEFRQKYGWADQYQERWRDNPLAVLQAQFDSLQQHGVYGPEALKWIARTLQARRGQGVAPAMERPKPDVPIVDANNNVTGYVYSDRQQQALDEYNRQQQDAALSERLRPLEQLRQTVEQAQARAQVEQESKAHALTTLETLRQNPYFKEHEAKVKAALVAHEEFGDNVHAAFAHVLTTEILPTLSQTEQKRVLDSLAGKEAGAGVNPGQSAPTQAPKFKSFGEAAAYFEKHPDEARAMAKL